MSTVSSSLVESRLAHTGLARELTLLHDTFGVPFVCVDTLDHNNASTESVPGKSAEYTIAPLAGNRYRVTFQLVTADAQEVPVTADMSTTDPAMLDRLAVCVSRELRTMQSPDCVPFPRKSGETRYELPAEDLQLDDGEYANPLEECCNELSRYLDEISCLRRLARQIESCKLNLSLAEVSGKIIEDLCDVIASESLTLLQSSQCNPRSSDELAIVFSAGVLPISEVELKTLVLHYGNTGCRDPQVLNHDALQQQDDLDGILTSLIVVSIPLGEGTGWLIALNKVTSTGDRVWDSRHELAAEEEFGTVEAGLLESTAVILEAHHRNSALYRQNQMMTLNVIQAISSAVDARDRYTRGHSERVARIARVIARSLGLPRRDCDQIYVSGLLHDIGKIGVPDTVLNKNGRLTEEEFRLIQKHPDIGYQIIKPITQLSFTLPGVRHHHEAVDGSGYPSGLKGAEIPLMARILAVADAYDAMTSDRPYRDGMPVDKAESILHDGTGTQWDPNVVAAFFNALEAIHEIVHELNLPHDNQEFRLADDGGFRSLLDDSLAESMLVEPGDVGTEEDAG